MVIRVEADNWGPGPSILAEDRLETLRAALEETAVIVEHWFYRGSSGPDRFVTESFDDLVEYLRHKTRPGDSIWCWRYDQLCRDDNSLTHAKVPDEGGMVPARGAY
jgi:hypothetical protein